MPEPKTPPATNHLEESRRLIVEMDAQLERARALLRRPALVAKPPRKAIKK